MPLINTSVPNLIQGVSQQSDATRFSGQCEEQENALSSVTGGLVKRPPLQHINKIIGTDIGANSFVHFIDRSPTEKYVLIVNSATNKLHIFDIDGNEQPIFPEGRNMHENGLFMRNESSTNAKDYLRALNPRESLRALTVADSTYIVNKEILVGLDTDNKTNEFDQEALVFIKQGDYGKKYGFQINAIVPTTTTTEYTHSEETLTVVPTSAVFGVDIIVKSTDIWGNVGGSGITNQVWGVVGTAYYWTIVDVNAVTIVNGGAGFGVGDVLTILPPSSGNGSASGTITSTGSNVYLYNQRPKLRVTSVTNVGEITGVEVTSTGMWKGSNLTAGASRTFTTSIPSTNSTTSQTNTWTTTETSVADDEVPLTVEIESATGLADNSDGTKRTAPGDADAVTILKKLNDKIDDTPDMTTEGDPQLFTVDSDEETRNLLVIKATASVKSFSISAFDGLNGLGIGVVYKEVNSLSELPAYAKDGFKVKVKGDADLKEDDYYVEFKTTGGTKFGTGAWVECLGPDLVKNFNDSTTPIEIVSNPQGQFKYRPMRIEDRKAGDDDTNPMPSFANGFINNVFFFKNRIGFLSQDNVIFSESGLGVLNNVDEVVFNFSRKTVATLLDDDPIDVTVSSSRVTDLNSTVAFQENLVLFSGSGQFVLKGGDLLTAKTISITPATNFEVEPAVDPLLLGSYIYFAFERGRFSGIREYTVNSSTDVYDSVEITEHVPAYIPRNVIHITGSAAEDVIAIVSRDDPRTVYIYTYFWNNKQKVLSSWSKFNIEGCDGIRGMRFIDDTLYMIVLNDTTGTHIAKMSFSSGTKDYYGSVSNDRVTLLDMRTLQHCITGELKFTGATGSGAGYNNVSYFAGTVSCENRIEYENSAGTTRLKYYKGKWYLCSDTSSGEVNIAVSARNYAISPWDANWGNTDLASATFAEQGTRNKIYLPYKAATNNVDVYRTNGTKISSTNPNNSNVVTLDRTFNQGTYFRAGTPYEMKYTFSEQLFKAKAGSGQTVSNAAKVLLRNGSVYYDGSYKFDVAVTPNGRSTQTSTFDNGTNKEDGFFRFPIFTSAEDATISLKNNTAFPSNFQSAEFESFVHNRSSRYG